MKQKLSFLLIVPFYACNFITGGGQRTSLIYQVLTSLGTVDVLVIGVEKKEYLPNFFPDVNELYATENKKRGELGYWKLLRIFNAKIVDFIARILGAQKESYKVDQQVSSFIHNQLNPYKYDFVVARYLKTVAISGYLDQVKVPVILDLDDRDDIVYESRANRPDTNFISKLILKWHSSQIKEVLQDLLPKFQHIWVANHTDEREVQHFSKSLLPNIPYIKEEKSISIKEDVQSKVILFVGSFKHRVNAEGIDIFVTQCWPHIYSAVEGVTFRIVGCGGWESVRDKYKNIPGLNIKGFVRDLSQEYQQSAFTIAPLFEGGGSKIKVLESLYYQRTVVITKYVESGYEILKDKESFLVSSNYLEIIENCIDLLNNTKLRSQLAKNGHNKVINHYSFKFFSSIIEQTISSLQTRQNK